MTAWLEDGAAETIESEVVFRFFAKIPGWSEKNFQVRAPCSCVDLSFKIADPVSCYCSGLI